MTTAMNFDFCNPDSFDANGERVLLIATVLRNGQRVGFRFL